MSMEGAFVLCYISKMANQPGGTPLNIWPEKLNV